MTKSKFASPINTKALKASDATIFERVGAHLSGIDAGSPTSSKAQDQTREETEATIPANSSSTLSPSSPTKFTSEEARNVPHALPAADTSLNAHESHESDWSDTESSPSENKKETPPSRARERSSRSLRDINRESSPETSPGPDLLPPPRMCWNRKDRESLAKRRARHGGWRDTNRPHQAAKTKAKCQWRRVRLNSSAEKKSKEGQHKTGTKRKLDDLDGQWEDDDADDEAEFKVATQGEVEMTDTPSDTTATIPVPTILLTDFCGYEWNLKDSTKYPPLPQPRYESWDEAIEHLRSNCPGLMPGARVSGWTRDEDGSCNFAAKRAYRAMKDDEDDEGNEDNEDEDKDKDGDDDNEDEEFFDAQEELDKAQ